MKIGFDAKRAFFNNSGLGNYSRNTIRLLSKFHPDNKYVLYTPSTKNAIQFEIAPEADIITPSSIYDNWSKSYWRSVKITKQLIKDKIDLYHGLSNELPLKIYRTNIKSIISVHDLIFIRYPELYKHVDRKIYIKKVRNGCKNADKIIAISQQTKTDLVNFLNIKEEKIEVVYQGCNPIFHKTINKTLKNKIKTKFNLPDNYILYVGTIEKRKNILNVIKAIHENKIDTPLIVVGKATGYLGQVKNYVEKHNLSSQILFYHNIKTADLPAFYQMADLFVYPSIFEGFGIPVLEAINSAIPVITSKGSCFSEAGGEHSIYINPENTEEIAEAITKALTNSSLREKMIEKGLEHAKKFNDKTVAENLMNTYLKII